MVWRFYLWSFVQIGERLIVGTHRRSIFEFLCCSEKKSRRKWSNDSCMCGYKVYECVTKYAGVMSVTEFAQKQRHQWTSKCAPWTWRIVSWSVTVLSGLLVVSLFPSVSSSCFILKSVSPCVSCLLLLPVVWCASPVSRCSPVSRLWLVLCIFKPCFEFSLGRFVCVFSCMCPCLFLACSLPVPVSCLSGSPRFVFVFVLRFGFSQPFLLCLLLFLFVFLCSILKTLFKFIPPASAASSLHLGPSSTNVTA